MTALMDQALKAIHDTTCPITRGGKCSCYVKNLVFLAAVAESDFRAVRATANHYADGMANWKSAAQRKDERIRELARRLDDLGELQ